MGLTAARLGCALIELRNTTELSFSLIFTDATITTAHVTLDGNGVTDDLSSMMRSRAITISVVILCVAGGLGLFGMKSCFVSKDGLSTVAKRSGYRVPKAQSESKVVPLSPLIPDTPKKTAANPDQLWVLSDLCVSAGLIKPVTLPGPNVRPHYMLTDGEFRINDYAADAIGLTPDETESMQQLADEVWTKMEILAAQYTEEDPLRMDPEKGIFAYRMAIPKEDGMRVISDFEHNVTSLLDPEKAKKAMLSFGWSNYFGAFGLTEVLVQFTEHSQYDGAPIMATYENRDPKDGRMVTAGTVGYENFLKEYGHVFKVQSSDGP